MVKTREIKRVINDRVEIKKLQIEEKKLQISQDFSEITLAISLLVGLWFIFWKIVDYFNSNIISLNNYAQDLISFFVIWISVEFLTVFLFILFKGYLVSTRSGNRKLRNAAQLLFKNSFKHSVYFTILSAVMSVVTVLIDFFIKDSTQSFIYIIIIFLIIFYITMRLTFKEYIHLLFQHIKSYLEKRKIDKRSSVIIALSLIAIITVLSIYLLLAIPTYFLMGSYSIDTFPQSNTNDDIITFTIKETGTPYVRNYINLYKLNTDETIIRQEIDSIVLNNTQGRSSKMMSGGKYEGVWYLNINTSNLSQGKYLLHTEVSNEFLNNITIFKSSPKQDNKLFYIAYRSTNYSINSTQTLSNSSANANLTTQKPISV